MSRRRRAVSRPIPKDAKFSSSLVTRLVNTVMERGKKSVAQRIVYGALDELIAKNPGANPLEVLQRAVDNAKPLAGGFCGRAQGGADEAGAGSGDHGGLPGAGKRDPETSRAITPA